jgi:hypothetical protein
MTTQKNTQPPAWLARLQEKGFEPYIATSRKLLPHLNTTPFGQKVTVYLMDDVDDSSFMEAYFMLEAYLLSNSLGFESPNLKMPHWVLIDCVLMQTAIVGFTLAKSAIPDELISYYHADEKIDLAKLKRIPVSGQICASDIGSRSMTGISLFSLGRRWLNGVQHLGLYSKTLALEVYKAKDYDYFYGITQYDNNSLKIHGRFTTEMEISQPIVPLHPGKDMTFIYKMKLDYDPENPGKSLPETEPTFWLAARDADAKKRMIAGMKKGKRYFILPPFSVKRDGGVFLPILEKEAA